MQKEVRRRLAYMTAGTLVVAMFGTAVWLSRPEPTLVEKATMVGPVDEGKQSWIWLSDMELLIVTTDRESDGWVTTWQGHADRWNIVSGEPTRLPGLTALFNRKGISPCGMPYDYQVSPNKNWLVWINHRTMDSWPYLAAAHLDGTHYSEWEPDRDGFGYFLDDGHWIDESFHHTPYTTVVALDDRRKDRAFPSNSPAGKEVVALHAIRQPTYVSIQNNKGGLDIITYRTIDTVAWDKDASSDNKDAPMPILKNSVQLPPDATLVEYGDMVSPQQTSILYHLYKTQTNPVLARLHRYLPSISEAPIDTESVWVSKADGKGFHELGHVILHRNKDEETEDGLSEIEWLPGGKRVAFVHHHTLYTVPIDIPK